MSRLVALYGAGVLALAALVGLAAADPWAARGGPDLTEAIVAGDVAGAITFELRPLRRSGEFGFVTFEPRAGGTRVAVELLTPGRSRVLLREGSCRRPGERLADFGVVTRRAGGNLPATALVTVEATPGDLRSGDRVVTVEREGAAVACADVGS